MIMAIKEKNSEKFTYIPASDVKIKEEDLLIVLGGNKDLEGLKKID